ncbi:MAG: hypothetical protein COU68_02880, partial [Candidatus Pacebacteria bacterium CG10_big_fil_rev_8_21_14_0_10_45_6]
ITEGTGTTPALTISAAGAISTGFGLSVGAGNTFSIGTMAFPTADGAANQVLMTNGAGALFWQTVSGAGTVTSITGGTGLTGGVITNTGTLAVNVGVGASQIPQLDGSGKLAVSTIPTLIPATAIADGSVTDAEFQFLGTVTSDVQVQLTGKEPAFAAGAVNQYLYSDKTWKQIDSDQITQGATNKFLTVNDYAAVGAMPASGAASQTVPLSERAGILIYEAIATPFAAHLTSLNALGPLAANEIAIGSAADTWTFVNFDDRVRGVVHPATSDTNFLFGSGVGSGTVTAIGLDNTGVGAYALAAITDGDENSAVGSNALAAVTTGTGNTAVGRKVLSTTTTGSSNTAIGAYSQSSVAIAVNNNTSLGHSSLTTATTSDNTAIGYTALNILTTGSQNTALGSSTMVLNTSGNNNVALGYGAAPLLSSGSGNTIIGRGAGAVLTTGSNNVAIGIAAGPNAVGTASNKLYIDMAQTDTPLVGGDFSTNELFVNYDMTAGGLGHAFYVGGTAYKTGGTTSWVIPSDARLKNVTGKFERGLSDILQLNTITFRYKKDAPIQLQSDRDFVGILAQEVLPYFPEAIKMNSNGYYSFEIDPILWGSVNAIKELHSLLQENQKLFQTMHQGLDLRVENLERKLASLQEENVLMKDYLCAKDPQAPFCKSPESDGQ